MSIIGTNNYSCKISKENGRSQTFISLIYIALFITSITEIIALLNFYIFGMEIP